MDRRGLATLSWLDIDGEELMGRADLAPTSAVKVEPRPLFQLSVDTAASWAADRGLVPANASFQAVELRGGVSATVVALRGPAGNLVLKQALPRLRVAEDWFAGQSRTNGEATLMSLFASLTPACVPQVLDCDPANYLMAMEFVPGSNWQGEIGAGRPQAEHAVWAGSTLAKWHCETTGLDQVDLPDGFEEELRLRPFHETVATRLPDTADAIRALLAALRDHRSCLVHGDYAMKNMLVGPDASYVLDFEAAHRGNPVFDVAFFLSYTVLSAIRWPALATCMRKIAHEFFRAYASGGGPSVESSAITAHTGALVLARTDGMSPAGFLDACSQMRARTAGLRMLRYPERGLW